MWFIVINLIIWTVKYWWTKAYSQILNQKDWQESMDEFSLLKPKTRVAIFYQDSQGSVWDDIDDNLWDLLDTETSAQVDDIINKLLSGEEEMTDDGSTNRNPYDPDYEDEFNSFFGITSNEAPEIISVEEIEDLEPAWFIVDEDTAN